MTGLTIAWLKAHHTGGVPVEIGVALRWLASALYLFLLVMYSAKLLRHPEAVKADRAHPIRLNFFPALGRLPGLCRTHQRHRRLRPRAVLHRPVPDAAAGEQCGALLPPAVLHLGVGLLLPAGGDDDRHLRDECAQRPGLLRGTVMADAFGAQRRRRTAVLGGLGQSHPLRHRLRGRRLSAGLAARRDDAPRRPRFTTPLRGAHPGAAADHVADYTGSTR